MSRDATSGNAVVHADARARRMEDSGFECACLPELHSQTDSAPYLPFRDMVFSAHGRRTQGAPLMIKGRDAQNLNFRLLMDLFAAVAVYRDDNGKLRVGQRDQMTTGEGRTG